jgi:hypothetical protein
MSEDALAKLIGDNFLRAFAEALIPDHAEHGRDGRDSFTAVARGAN